jgi:hypothetical protein
MALCFSDSTPNSRELVFVCRETALTFATSSRASDGERSPRPPLLLAKTLPLPLLLPPRLLLRSSESEAF